MHLKEDNVSFPDCTQTQKSVNKWSRDGKNAAMMYGMGRLGAPGRVAWAGKEMNNGEQPNTMRWKTMKNDSDEMKNTSDQQQSNANARKFNNANY